MECVAACKSKGLVLFAVAFLYGCPNAVEEASNSVTAQQEFTGRLAGSWSVGCWLDSDAQILHLGWEDEFSKDGTFKIVWSLFGDSRCDTDPVARVTYSGTFAIGKEVVAAFEQNPDKKVPAREIDYHIDRAMVEGHLVLAQTALRVSMPISYYDITYVENNSRYDGNDGLVTSLAERSTQLYSEAQRTSALSARLTATPPNFDVAPTAGKFEGRWDDGCVEDGQSPGYYQNYEFTFALPNTMTYKSALWKTSNCTTGEIASVTFFGTFTLVDTVTTASSKAKAARMEFKLAPAAEVTGDADLAAASLPSTTLAGGTYYHLVVHDADYDLFFYGGWFEDSLDALPADVDSIMAKFGRAPLKPRLPRAARAGRD